MPSSFSFAIFASFSVSGRRKEHLKLSVMGTESHLFVFILSFKKTTFGLWYLSALWGSRSFQPSTAPSWFWFHCHSEDTANSATVEHYSAVDMASIWALCCLQHVLMGFTMTLLMLLVPAEPVKQLRSETITLVIAPHHCLWTSLFSLLLDENSSWGIKLIESKRNKEKKVPV